jgi:hypothetical protein
MSGDERWYVQLRLTDAEIDWQTQGDPLIQYLRDAIEEPLTLTRWLIPGLEQPNPMASNGHCLYSENIPTRLIFAFLADRFQVLVESDSPIAEGSRVEPWMSALDTAYARLLEEEPAHEWRSVIGTRYTLIGDLPKLVEGGVIGGITIEAAVNPYTEYFDNPHNPSLGGASIYSSYPLVVHGETPGYNWDAVKRRVSLELNTICALFTLEFGSAWLVRRAMQYGRNQSGPLPTMGYGVSDGPHVQPVLGSTREVRIPAWMNDAKAKVDTNDVLYRALHAHRQGMLLMDEHPSLALVSFVSAIEEVGSTLVDLTTCECCGMMKGAGKRFRQALKTVYSNREAAPFNEIYDLRSRTVHSGVLHGDETHMGAKFLIPEIFAAPSPSINFNYQTLWKMRDASKAVLLKQLTP